jgi:hypothetical protein
MTGGLIRQDFVAAQNMYHPVVGRGKSGRRVPPGENGESLGIMLQPGMELS